MKNKVYQFKIELKEITPPIWRRILVPESYNFWDLHVAIQDSMGWLDYHLHVFRIRRKHAHKTIEIGIPNEDRFDDEPEILPDWEYSIDTYFLDVGMKCEYEYDFGDEWLHEILLEGILLRDRSQKYPKCISGARACPPEDCGGVHGYENLLLTIKNPEDAEYEETMTWLGGNYNPEAFNPDRIKFDNPKKRWERAFSQGL